MPGDCAKDRTERSKSEGMVVWNRDPVVSGLGGLQDDVAADLVHPRVLPFSAQEVSEAHRKRREESSCHQEDFVADKVKPNSLGRGRSKKNPAVASSTFLRNSSHVSASVKMPSVRHSAQ